MLLYKRGKKVKPQAFTFDKNDSLRKTEVQFIYLLYLYLPNVPIDSPTLIFSKSYMFVCVCVF